MLFRSALVEVVLERLKQLGVTGYTALFSLALGILVAIAGDVQLLPLASFPNPLVSNVVSGIIISGGSNFVNSARDRIKP